jgi:hypothetical protein
MRDGNRWIRGWAAAIVCLATELAGSPTVAAQTAASLDVLSSHARVRSDDQFVAGLIARASLGSSTFRGLLTAIEATNGIVYVESGRCGHGARACLQLWMQSSGRNRFLRVLVDRQRADSDLDLMGSIGHELQHAIEALSDVAVVNGTMLYNFFRRYAPTDNNRFETTEAINMGNAVRDELRRQVEVFNR